MYEKMADIFEENLIFLFFILKCSIRHQAMEFKNFIQTAIRKRERKKNQTFFFTMSLFIVCVSVIKLAERNKYKMGMIEKKNIYIYGELIFAAHNLMENCFENYIS